MTHSGGRGWGLVAGVALDGLLGDPTRYHPVAGFGAAAAAVERRSYADSRAAGAIFTAVLLAPLCLTAWVVERRITGSKSAFVGTAGLTWTVLGGRSLRRAGTEMAVRLREDDLAGARNLVPTLCGRDPDTLDAEGIARATVESIAENTSDSIVAPLLWGGLAGLPGLLGYRAVNTLDAMVGHRSARYANFGTPSARLDDLANLVPARVTGALTLLAAPLVGGSARRGWAAWRSDAARHPSPNAGRCEAAMAGVLGVSLGGPTIYGGKVDQRPVLGTGAAPGPRDIDRSVRISRAVELLACVLVLLIAVVKDGRRR